MSTATEPAKLPPALFALIAAAIHVAHGSQMRIVTIIPLQEQDWAREGRRDIFSSHRLR